MCAASILESIPSWAWPVLASAGGALVFFGLWMEKGKEKDWFTSAKDLRKQEWKAKWGWRFLMAGILFEVVIGGLLAAKDEMDAPLNQPVSDMKAIAVIDVTNTNFYPIDFSVLQDTSLELMGTNIYRDSFFGLIPNNFPRQFVHKRFADNSVTFTGYAFEFVENPVPPFEFDNFTNFVKPPRTTVKEVLNEIKVMRFYINFIPKNAQILGGHVTLEINGFPKEFRIYAQTTDTNLSAWNPNIKGIFLYATNSIP